ncbi:MAG: hypothetical protein AAF622_13560 [Cyanobacteria bacterium P01_C01_bin.147]
MAEWDDPDYIQILPEAVDLEADAGRQVEGFLDIAHFAFIHAKSFGEQDNTIVPDYPIEQTPTGFQADYISTVSNYAHGMKHRAPPDFQWRRLFEVFWPFTAKLSVTFPNGRLHILKAAAPISARKTRVFAPICRNFDKDRESNNMLVFPSREGCRRRGGFELLHSGATHPAAPPRRGNVIRLGLSSLFNPHP